MPVQGTGSLAHPEAVGVGLMRICTICATLAHIGIQFRCPFRTWLNFPRNFGSEDLGVSPMSRQLAPALISASANRYSVHFG